jgi:hypothetical protein
LAGGKIFGAQTCEKHRLPQACSADGFVGALALPFSQAWNLGRSRAPNYALAIARHLIDLCHPGRSLAERTAVARIEKKIETLIDEDDFDLISD